MGLDDALQAPIVVTMGKDSLRFVRLDMDDLAAWCAEIKNSAKQLGQARINSDKALDPQVRIRALRLLDKEEVEMSEVIKRAYTPAGIKRILTTSLVKSGQCKNEGEAEQIIKQRLHFSAQQSLAFEVLSAPPAEEEPQRPLADSGDTAATGSANDSTSPNSAESTPAS